MTAQSLEIKDLCEDVPQLGHLFPRVLLKIRRFDRFSAFLARWKSRHAMKIAMFKTTKRDALTARH
jgi:hypothetical protein